MARFAAVPVDMAGGEPAGGAVETAGRHLCSGAVLGRPVNRHLNDGGTLKVLRLAGDGTTHSGSFLYGAAARAAAATAYRGLVTYTLASEPGTSLRAASWEAVAEAHGRSWLCPARPRPGAVKGEANHRWERQLGERPPEPRAVWLGLTQPVEQAPLEALRAA